MKSIVVYFSHKGENYWNGGLKNLTKGNTEIVAEFVQKAVGGELFEVETVKEYAYGYNDCIDEAQRELRSNARPAIKKTIPLDAYDVVFVGFPNWWGTMPMAMFTLFEQVDLTGKIIIPFCTNEGSGMGSSERDLQKLCKGARVLRGLSIRGTAAAQSEKQVASWAKKSLEEASAK